ncbi:MAG: helix-turn-helix domain-containing protein [Deferribacteres bacterium]|nr:helix-turn-helix domain-containing protein [candidate division KSB1 bacterium]MCB9503092.1 helix-turn-helix domain-containing protein [Deferribacteres bacterium]
MNVVFTFLWYLLSRVYLQYAIILTKFNSMDDGYILRKTLNPHWMTMSPKEIKLFMTLYWFADPDSQYLEISFESLAKKANLSRRAIKSSLKMLEIRSLVAYHLTDSLNQESKFILRCPKSFDDTPSKIPMN